ncbi:MAG: hypothetical protein KL787_06630 [Taibaiella sp.]|nr:hypothetical protein [Taibaiella sp.]
MMNPVSLILSIWFRGFLFYAFFTLPSLFLPLMYLMSMMLAFFGSFLAVLMLVLYMMLLRNRMKYEEELPVLTHLLVFTGIFTFLATIAVSVYFTHESPFSPEFWRCYLEFILFPVAGLCAALISIWSYRFRLLTFFHP